MSSDDTFTMRSVAVSAFGPSVMYGLSEGLMLPVLAISVIHLGATEAVASLVVSLLGVGSLITNIPSGILTTRFGERRSMVFAASISAVGLVLCLFQWNLLFFAVGVFLIGSASSVFLLARQSYLADVVPVHMRARAMSTLGGVQRLGLFAGPFITAGVVSVGGLRAAYVVSLVAIVAAGVLALVVPDLERVSAHKGLAQRSTTRGMLRDHWRIFLTLGTAVLLLSAIRSTRQVVVPLWATHIGLDPVQSSLIYGIAGAVDATIFYPAGYVMDRFGRRWIAIPCVLIMGLSFIIMPFTHQELTLIIVAVVMGFGNGIGSGIVNTLGSDVSPSAGRPTFLGLWRELADAGSAAGPLLLSFVAGVLGLAIGIVVSGAVGLAAAVALARWIPRRKPA
ncbi:MAG: transporter [Microbacteriaceae bacterium]|nr:transporter [Microbacteriaceae bacterium]